MKIVRWLVIALLVGSASAEAKLAKGDPAPAFGVPDVRGESVSPAGGGLTILTFLSLDSKPSRELALTLATLVKEHGGKGLRAIAVAAESPDRFRDFDSQHSLGYTLCADPERKTFATWGAGGVLPLTFLVAPDGMIAQALPGGGAAIQQMLLAVAEKEFARGNAESAESLFDQVADADPSNVEARAGRGFALARKGKLERAEEEFRTLGKLGGAGSRLAAEGLATVALRRGDVETARREIDAAPGDSTYLRVIRGEIAAQGGKLDEAGKEFRLATAQPASFDWQRASAFTNLARVTAEGSPDKAIEAYDKAIAEEPFLAEARSDKAVALEKAGRVTEAKKVLEEARAVAPSDELALALLRQIEERERERADIEKRRLTNDLVKELAEAFRKGDIPAPKGDEWTPRPLVVSFLGMEDRLGPLARGGMIAAFLSTLSSELREGGVRVVERELLDQLLTELRLGSSDLADPATRLKLGKVLASAVIGSGGLYGGVGKGRLELRLIDVETTEVRETVSRELPSSDAIVTFAREVAGELQGTLRKTYPLKGKIADVDGGDIVVAIGKKHGAAPGLRFRVVEQGKPVEVDGEVIGYRQQEIGTIEIVDAQEGFAVAKSVSGSGFVSGQRLIEVAP